MRNLLIFCYFLLIFLNVSCGETKKKEVLTTTNEIEVLDSLQATTKKNKSILFFGDSLTAGMGINIEDAFPAIIQRKIDSLGLPYQVINAGLSGETTAGGKNRIDWVLNQDIDIFVLELGANDGLRGVPLNETKNNLQSIIDFVRQKNPEVKIILTGMQIPPNLGVEYTTEFKKIFPELAAKNKLKLIPFLLENVAGNPELNQNDGIHPTEEGHKILAKNAWEVLKSTL
jgi:acyl-CoA thioesterase-1